MSNRPLILISNDDGFRAKGINDLADFVSDIGDIVIVAPDGSRSGTSMSITGHIPVELKKISEQPGRAVYSLTGTPVDCVKMACECVLDRRQDNGLGGINHGDNSSVNTLYSGTMGLVMEACLKGIPAVGFSSCYCASDAPFGALRRYIIRVVRYVIENGLPPYTCLNVNFPATEQIKGLRVRRMGHGDWQHEWQHQVHPRGWDYYWLTGNYSSSEPESTDTDTHALEEGYACITPVRVDMTAFDLIPVLKQLEVNS